MTKLILSLFVIFVLIVFINLIKRKTAEQPAQIPLEYKTLYQKLEKDLEAFNTYLDQYPTLTTEPVYAAELLTANANRGEALLTDGSWQGNMLYLDSLQNLGIQGVTVAIAYPLFSDTFPRHSEYIAFYKKLASEIRRRNLKLMVKTGLIFPQKEFSSLGVDYSHLTVDQYLAEKKKMATIIATEIKPDYLTLGSEPQTEASLLGKKITSNRYARYVNETLAGLSKNGLLVGVGIGSWEDIDFVKQYITIPDLDFVDIHIYPLNSKYEDYLTKAITIIDLSQSAGKKVTISEFWLYKANHQDLLKGAVAPDIFKRDVFGFWSPLDSKMLETMAKLARKKGVIFLSPFWSKYFFAYLDYNLVNRNKSASFLLSEVDKQAAKNMMLKKVTKTGEAYKAIINRH